VNSAQFFQGDAALPASMPDQAPPALHVQISRNGR
jgi:hypothetical protein